MGLVQVWFRSGLIWFGSGLLWFGSGSGLVLIWFGSGLGLVRVWIGAGLLWFGSGSGLVLIWFGSGSGQVRVWIGAGLIWFWSGSGLVRVWIGAGLIWFWSGSGLVWSALVLVEHVRAGGDGGHGPDPAVEFPPAAERRDRRGAQQETRQQGEPSTRRHESCVRSIYKNYKPELKSQNIRMLH